ncbi:MAG TPA: DinB family protein [Parafilimonas sp.]|nr:DinB family protein [Parafilimonas sp.]
MLNTILADLYERDLRNLIEEVNLFKNEENLWRTQGSVKNSCGTLVLHITGGLNHFFGATLAHTGYVRDRDQEFSKKGVKREELVAQLEQVIPMMNETLSALTTEQMGAAFPIFFDKPNTSVAYVAVRLLAHLGYHLGQVNYLRRVLE